MIDHFSDPLVFRACPSLPAVDTPVIAFLSLTNKTRHWSASVYVLGDTFLCSTSSRAYSFASFVASRCLSNSLLTESHPLVLSAVCLLCCNSALADIMCTQWRLELRALWSFNLPTYQLIA